MIALSIIVLLLIIILLLPVGVSSSFISKELYLAVKIGPFRLRLIPAKKKASGEKTEKKTKPQKEKKPKDSSKEKPKLKFELQDILDIAKIGLKALSRFGKSLSIDELMLRLTVGTDDPYDTVVRYGYINAALGGVLPLLHRAVKIRQEDIGTAMSFEDSAVSADFKLTATLQIWEILHIATCAGAAALVWFIRVKRKSKAQAAENNSEKGC